MDRNTLVGFILLALMTVGYVLYTNNEQQKLDAYRQEQKMVADSLAAIEAAKAPKIEVDSVAIKEQIITESLGSFSELAKGEEEFLKVETEDCIYTFSNLGGSLYSVELKEYLTFDKKPLILFEGDDNSLDVSFVSNENKRVRSSQIYFKTEATDKKLKGEESYTLRYVLESSPGKEYIHEYIIPAQGYVFDFNIRLKNMAELVAATEKTLSIDWTQKMPSLERNVKEEQMYSNLYYRTSDKYVDELSSRKPDDKVLELGVEWVSFKQKFFNNTLVSKGKNFEPGARMKIRSIEDDEDYIKDAAASLSVPLGNPNDFEWNMQWVFAPNQYNELKRMKIGLDEVIPLGWAIFGWVNKFMIIPIFNVLNNFISNYGIIILILTLIIKLALSPLNQKQLVSAAKMQILKPDIDLLKKKYGDDKQAIGAKQMELFRNAGVNPVGGCLPMLLQMPILFAMYRFFPNSIELRQQPFLWADDLSHYDSILTLPFNIPIYGDHVSLFTLLMTATSFVYMQITMKQQQTGMTDDMMAMQMKIMQYISPLMFLFIFNSFSAALSYYYFLFNLMSIAQTVLIKRFFIDENALRAEIEENKKKPKKKSAWQEKMDQMMQQQQEAKKAQSAKKGK